MVKRCLYVVLLCSILSPSALLAADKVPQPEGWVSDYAGVITGEYSDKINGLISELEEKTSAEIAIVSIQSIAPYDEKEYARLLFDNWRPGKKGKDNGILILLAVKERRWRIETGYGLEGILPDGLSGEIGRKYMVPYFREGKYGEGLYYGVAAIARVIAQGGHTKADSGTLSPLFVVLLIIIIILIIAIRLTQVYGRYYYYGNGRVGGTFGGGGFGGGGFGGFGGGGGGGGGAGGGF